MTIYEESVVDYLKSIDNHLYTIENRLDNEWGDNFAYPFDSIIDDLYSFNLGGDASLDSLNDAIDEYNLQADKIVEILNRIDGIYQAQYEVDSTTGEVINKNDVYAVKLDEISSHADEFYSKVETEYFPVINDFIVNDGRYIGFIFVIVAFAFFFKRLENASAFLRRVK